MEETRKRLEEEIHDGVNNLPFEIENVALTTPTNTDFHMAYLISGGEEKERFLLQLGVSNPYSDRIAFFNRNGFQEKSYGQNLFTSLAELGVTRIVFIREAHRYDLNPEEGIFYRVENS